MKHLLFRFVADDSRILPLRRLARVVGVLVLLLVALLAAREPRGDSDPGWTRHTIDRSSTGADGVRFADCNGDRLPDIATGWEEGGVTRLYLHPGYDRVREPWPAVTAGPAGSVEDAVLVDLDGDGRMDVVSCSEGNVRSVWVHWAPTDLARILDATAWRTEALPVSRGKMWMFALPFDVDGQKGVDLVAGGKLAGAELGWFESPSDARRAADWRWHAWRPVGWLMSLIAADMDGDGDTDVVFSDRRGPRSGCFWLENPGPARAASEAWKEHPIGGLGREVMFVTLADLDRDGLQDVIAAVRPREILFLRRLGRDGDAWEPRSIALPDQSGDAKAVSVGDVDLDGRPDLVFSCENARPPRRGVFWVEYPKLVFHPIAAEGIKFDLVPLMDLDGDGDLDAITTEETAGLGVVWYENPARPRARRP